MNRVLLAAGVVALASLGTVPAKAGVSADFSGCDGLKKPKSKDDGMRGDAIMPAYGATKPQTTISSCTRALAAKELKASQNLRRAHLLRARAAAYLELKQADEAFADLDAAEAELAGYRGEFFFDRSMGLSLDLLRAIALYETGRADEARPLAESAATSRPYAMQVQMAATILRDATAPTAEGTAKDVTAIWSPLARISPAARAGMATRIRAGEAPKVQFEHLVADIGEDPLDLPSEPSMGASMQELLSGNLGQRLALWLGQYRGAATLAYAHAALGHEEKARARMAELDAAVATTKEKTAGTWGTLPGEIMQSYEEKELRPLMALVRARIALNEERAAAVPELLGSYEYEEGSATSDLYAAYDAVRTSDAGSLPELPALKPASVQGMQNLNALASTLLIVPEDARKLIDYKKSRPDVIGGLLAGVFSMGTSLLGGFDRTNGFRSEQLESGAIQVEYTGGTTSGSVVQEMTLLRAAEIAIEAGKTHFIVNDRKDYGVYWGNTFERTMTGYKTILEFGYRDADSADPSAIDAMAVVDALGPIYYGDAPS